MQVSKITSSLFIFLALASFVFALSTSNSPSSCSGGWTTCSNAFADDTNRATATATGSANVTGKWNSYGFSLPAGASIDNLTVRADFFASRTSGFIDVQVSNDGGSTYGPSHAVGGNTAEQTFTIDVTSDFAWTASSLSNIVVNATCFKVGGGTNPTCSLDWIPVTVNYTEFNYSVSVAPSSDSVAQGNSASTAVTTTLLGGISQEVNLSSTGCPPSATCSFNVTTGNPTFLSTFTVSTTGSTPASTYVINVTGTSGSLVKTALYTLTVTGCTHSNPTVTLSPANQNLTAGTQGDYTVTVVNNDDTLCGASDFDMTSSIPSGWSASFVNATLTINPLGGSEATTFSLTSEINATLGPYQFSNTATNAAAPSFSGTDFATYSVI